MTTEERLGALEERTSQHDAAISDVRAELRALNARFDRLFYTLLGLLIAQAGVILTVVLRT